MPSCLSKDSQARCSSITVVGTHALYANASCLINHREVLQHKHSDQDQVKKEKSPVSYTSEYIHSDRRHCSVAHHCQSTCGVLLLFDTCPYVAAALWWPPYNHLSVPVKGSHIPESEVPDMHVWERYQCFHGNLQKQISTFATADVADSVCIKYKYKGWEIVKIYQPKPMTPAQLLNSLMMSQHETPDCIKKSSGPSAHWPLASVAPNKATHGLK